MRTPDSPEVYRNMGFWNNATQEGILDTSVAIGGLGGAGYLIGVELAHMGVQRFSIADPEGFENVNANRVIGAREDTYGLNKAEVFRDEVYGINPDAEVRTYIEGVNADNVEEFMHGADLVFDATELSMPELGTMICREARRIGSPVVNVEYVAHAAQGTSFDPRSKMTFERFMGIEGGEDAPLDEVADQKIATDRFLAYVPPYADLATLKALNEGAPLPSNMIGAGIAAQIATAEALKHIRRRVGERGLSPILAPEVRWMDAYTGKGGSTRHPRISFYRHLATAVVRNQLHLNEEASYSKEQRAARGDVGSMVN
jgi:hypothetical protein